MASYDLLVRELGNVERRTSQPFYRGGRGGRSGRGGGGGRSGVSFTQTGCGCVGCGRGGQSSSFTRSNDDNSSEIVAGSDGESKLDIMYYGCQFHGHYRGECPYEGRTGVVSVHLGKSFTQEGKYFDIKVVVNFGYLLDSERDKQ